MAKKPADSGGERVKVRVLVRCSWGAPDEVVQLSAADAEHAAQAGEVDPNPAAVAYAETLKTAGSTSPI